MSLLLWTIILLVAIAIVYFIIPKKGKGIKLGGKKQDSGSTTGENE